MQSLSQMTFFYVQNIWCFGLNGSTQPRWYKVFSEYIFIVFAWLLFKKKKKFKFTESLKRHDISCFNFSRSFCLRSWGIQTSPLTFAAVNLFTITHLRHMSRLTWCWEMLANDFALEAISSAQLQMALSWCKCSWSFLLLLKLLRKMSCLFPYAGKQASSCDSSGKECWQKSVSLNYKHLARLECEKMSWWVLVH